MKRTAKKSAYYSCLISLYIIAAAAVAAGSAVVSVNCHNAMNSDKMTLIELGEKNGSRVLTVMGRDYILP